MVIFREGLSLWEALLFLLGGGIVIVINGLTIKVHKNNTAGFSLHLTGDELPEDGTLVRFRVKKSPEYNIPIIEKIIPIENNIIDIDIDKSDTANMDPGKYIWNVAILYDDVSPWTLLEPAPYFIVLPEDGGR
jgi:hypothetical protein